MYLRVEYILGTDVGNALITAAETDRSSPTQRVSILDADASLGEGLAVVILKLIIPRASRRPDKFQAPWLVVDVSIKRYIT
jgi:hypothetical protein